VELSKKCEGISMNWEKRIGLPKKVSQDDDLKMKL
jgi:hypothetical protein